MAVVVTVTQSASACSLMLLLQLEYFILFRQSASAVHVTRQVIYSANLFTVPSPTEVYVITQISVSQRLHLVGTLYSIFWVGIFHGKKYYCQYSGKLV